ncbi:matrix metalloproteinase-14 [Octopus bimaculoides]|nr:matrix metalloproteinase-14 [Octopus bimaculoides]|eukprot:XP_014770461.1 PREDICTED: matrix metalloproteinase-14-like [Octopus bimaculoides]
MATPKEFRQKQENYEPVKKPLHVTAIYNNITYIKYGTLIYFRISVLQVWSDVTSLTFKQLAIRNTDIDVLFAAHEHGDRHPFDGIGGTLAHAFFPEFGGDAHFDDSEPWSVDSWKGVNLFQVAAHEIGHSLGLAHSDVNDALMAPFYRGYKPNFKLSRDDIAAVQELYGDKYYRLSGTGIDVGYPRKIEWDWFGVTGPIDAALTWDNSYTFIFKGDEYWKFDHMKAVSGYPRKIRDGFKGVPDNIDAAFVWGGNGKTYFIKGQLYWRWAKYGVDFGYPKQLNVWVNLPSRVTAVFKWQNGKTYFFKDDTYYRFNDKNFRVDEGYPRKVSTWWLGCNDDTQNQMHHNVHSIITAHPSILNPPRTRKPPRGSQDENENMQTKLQITQNEAYRTNCHITLLLTTFFTIVFFLRQ